MSTPQFDVFLSHNSRDKPAVERLALKLQRDGLEPWLDKWFLSGGGDWQHELALGLRSSSACAFFVGPHGQGDWARMELAVALDRAAKERTFRLFLVLLPGLPEPFDATTLPPFLSTRTWVDLRRGIDDPKAVQQLINAIKGIPLGPEVSVRAADDRCPYRGLQIFDEEHAALFFGRDADIQRLVERLKTTRFLGVLGPSGSGKSSLVRAGLVPALRKDALPGSHTWTICVVTPGAHPLTALATQLTRLSSHEATHRTLDHLRADVRALHLAVQVALAEHPTTGRVLWLVDQFEEVFTLCRDEHERSQFLENLLYAACIPDGHDTAVLSMRADFYPKCADYPDLSQRIAMHQFLVSPMELDGLQQAIEDPAWLSGFELEEGLVETILDDVGHQPGTLPLLEHALLELWQRRRGHMLTLEGYRESGGVQGAIAKRAEGIYRAFGPDEQAIARRTLLRLTQPGEGTEDTRRRAALAELMTRSGERQAVEGVVDSLVDARLLTVSLDELAEEQWVDVSHEALIRGWPRLRRWIDEDRTGLRVHRQLTEAALEWERFGHDEGGLYRGARLAAAVEYEVSHVDELNTLERAFVQASVALRKREQAEAGRRRRNIMVGLVTGLFMAVALTGVAGLQWRRALDQQHQAEAQRQVAVSRALGTQALNQIGDQLDLSLLLSVEANHAAATFEGRNSLLRALERNPRFVSSLHGHTGPVETSALSSDGTMLVSGGYDKTVRLWDVVKRRQLGPPLRSHTNISGVALSPDGTMAAYGVFDGTIRLWDVSTRRQLGLPLKNHGNDASSLAFSPDGRMLAVGGDDGTVELLDVIKRRVLSPPLPGPPGVVSGVAFSPDGKTLASARGDSIRFWDVAKRQPLGLPLTGPDSLAPYLSASVAFSPDGKILASSFGGSTVRLWDVAQRKSLGPPLTSGRDDVYSVTFSPDGKILAAAGEGKAIRLWDVAQRKSLGPLLTSRAEYFDSVKFSPDGKTLFAGGSNGDIQLWDMTDQQPLVRRLAGHQGPVWSVAFSPDGKTLASGGDDRTIRLWDVAHGLSLQPPLSRSAQVGSVAFSSNGKILASGGADLRLWDIGKRRELGPPSQRKQGADWYVAATADGKILAASSVNNTIHLWDVTRRRPLSAPLHVSVSNGDVYSLAFSPDGRIFAAGGEDGIQLWDVASRQPLGPSLDGTDVRDLAFSPDSAILASIGRYSTSSTTPDGIDLWNVSRRKLLEAPLFGQSTLGALAFSPDGAILASGSTGVGGHIRLWDVASGQALGPPLLGDTGEVQDLAFSPDGKILASGYYEGPILLLDLNVGSWERRACSIANRNLTRDEWQRYLGGPYRKTC